MRFLPEPARASDTPPKAGVLLVNLGTPEAPSAAAVRRYLKQFLSDPRVVEIPRAIWWPILNGVILPRRAKQSAQKYAKIWSAEGSPLRVHTERQAQLLRTHLAQRTEQPVAVEWAMRYGNPPVRQGLLGLRDQGCDRVLVIPLYPQYAASSTASAYDAVFAAISRLRNAPALRLVKHFHDDRGYLAALAQSVREAWAARGRPDLLVMSFHGLPRYSVDRGDPYLSQCQTTARLLAEALGLSREQHLVTFQSRFGRAEWLKPYTIETLRTLGKRKTRRVDVICPGFVADCLETLEEIALENKAAFLAAGGGEFHLIPCLDERDDWIRALANLALANMQGWLDRSQESGVRSQEG